MNFASQNKQKRDHVTLLGKIFPFFRRGWARIKLNSSKNIQVGKRVVVYEGFKCILSHLNIGDGTRLHANFYARGSAPVSIGKYCGFGEDVRILTGNHDMTKPALSMSFNHYHFGSGHLGKSKPVEIGNDVWVGDRVTILSGVKIGSGAVIGAGAVVSKDIPDYAIAAGVPAKVISYRFDPKTIEGLLKLAWWDWSEEKIKRNKVFFSADLTKTPQALQAIE